MRRPPGGCVDRELKGDSPWSAGLQGRLDATGLVACRGELVGSEEALRDRATVRSGGIEQPSRPICPQDSSESEGAQDRPQALLALGDRFHARLLLPRRLVGRVPEPAHEGLHLAHLAPFAQDLGDPFLLVFARVRLGFLVRRKNLGRVQTPESRDQVSEFGDCSVAGQCARGLVRGGESGVEDRTGVLLGVRGRYGQERQECGGHAAQGTDSASVGCGLGESLVESSLQACVLARRDAVAVAGLRVNAVS